MLFLSWIYILLLICDVSRVRGERVTQALEGPLVLQDLQDLALVTAQYVHSCGSFYLQC